MKTTRRDFIKNSALLGTGLLTFPFDSYWFAEVTFEFPDKIGVCTDLSNNYILSVAGFAFIEEGVRNFLVPAESDAAFRNKLSILKKSKLPVETCNAFIPGDMKSVGPAAAHDEIVKFATKTFQRAQIAGVKIIVFGSGGSRSIPPEFPKEKAREQFVNLCKRMAPVAEKHNVVISLEPLNTGECNFINSLEEGGEIVREVNNVNFRLLADIYHMSAENENPQNILKYRDLLYHIHIAEKAGRSAPGVHNEDFTPFFKALKNISYKGRISIECNWKDLKAQAGKALQTIKEQYIIS